jgi:hypothetical protein
MLRNLLFYGVDRVEHPNIYQSRQNLLRFVESYPGAPLTGQLLDYIRETGKNPDNYTLEGIDAAIKSFVDRVVKEESKLKVRQIVSDELGPESSKLVLAYIQTLESLTEITTTAAANDATAAVYLDSRAMGQVIAQGRRRPWKERKFRRKCPKAFLMEVYGPWIGKGLTMAILRKADIDLYHRLNNWRRKPGNDLPRDMLPTRDDLLTKQIAFVAATEASVPRVDRAKLSERLMRRRARALQAEDGPSRR